MSGHPAKPDNTEGGCKIYLQCQELIASYEKNCAQLGPATDWTVWSFYCHTFLLKFQAWDQVNRKLE